jgi:hypothetical protein
LDVFLIADGDPDTLDPENFEPESLEDSQLETIVEEESNPSLNISQSQKARKSQKVTPF